MTKKRTDSPPRRPAGWLDGLLRDGTLAQLARECRDQREMIARLEMLEEAFQSARKKLRQAGRHFPSFDELQSQDKYTQQKTDKCEHKSCDYEVGGRWSCEYPSITAGTQSNRAASAQLVSARTELNPQSPFVDVDVSDFDEEAPTQPGNFRLPASEVKTDAEPHFPIGNAQPENSNIDVESSRSVIPDGHFEKGRSTLIDGGGNVRLVWHKTTVSNEQYREALLDAVRSLAEPMRGVYEPIAAPVESDDELLTVYTVGDAHLGMMTYSDETGSDHDLKIGSRDLIAGVDNLVSRSEPSESAVVLSLGDLMHFDNESGTTTRGTRQDADTRWHKVMLTTIETMRRCIDRALEKHNRVRGILIRGNHDRHGSAAIAMALSLAYERDERVEIDQLPDPFSWIRFGKNLIGANHSDEASKPETLAAVMACDRREDWGQTLYRYMLCGHLHHTFAKEAMGVLVERFPTLAPKDAWHHGQGYRAQQSMCVDTYHTEWGRVGRRYVGIRQLRAA